MSRKKSILMWVSAIFMIVSGLVVGALCLVVIVNPNILEQMVEDATISSPEKYEATRTLYHWLASIITAGSVVGIVFGGISIKFCTYSSIEFYQKKSVVLTVAIICTLVVNVVVGAIYIIAVCIPDENLNLDGVPLQKPQVDLDKIMGKMEKLQKMREQNLINDDEFIKLKSEILAGTGISDIPEKTKTEKKANGDLQE